MLGKIEVRRKRGRQDEIVGWHHRLNGHEFVEWLGDDLSNITFILHFISNLILPLKYLSKAQRLRTLAIEYILVAYLFCI